MTCKLARYLLALLACVPLASAQDDTTLALRSRLHEALRRRPTRGTLFDRWRASYLDHGSSEAWLEAVLARARTADATAADLVLLAWVHLHRNEVQDADRELERAVARAPDSAEVRAARAHFLVDRGDDEGALPHLERAVVLARSELERSHLQREHLDVLLRLGRLEDAQRTFEETLRSAQDALPLREDMARALMERRFFAAAREQWTLLAEHVPDPTRRVQAQWNVATCLQGERRRDEARALLERVHASLEPTSWLARQTFDRLERCFLDESAEAWLAYLERSCREHPDDLERARLHARWLARTGHVDEASRLLATWLERRRDDPDLHRERITLLREASRFEELVRALTVFVETFPERPEGLLELGDALRLQAYASTPFDLDLVLAARDRWLAILDRWPDESSLHRAAAVRLADLVRSLAAREETSALRRELREQVLRAHRSARALASDPVECSIACLDFLADRGLARELDEELERIANAAPDGWDAKERLARWARSRNLATVADDWVQQHLSDHEDDAALRLDHAEHLRRVAPASSELEHHVDLLASADLRGELLERAVRLRIERIRDHDTHATAIERLEARHANATASLSDLWCLALLLEFQDPERSVLLYEQAHDRAPDEEPLGTALALALGRTQRHEASARAFEELARRFEPHADRHIESAVQAWMRAERYGQARELVGTLLERAPDHTGWQRLAASIEFQLGNGDRGRELLSRALGHEPRNVDVRLTLADWLDDQAAFDVLLEGIERVDDEDAQSKLTVRLALLVQESPVGDTLRERFVEHLERERPRRGSALVSRTLVTFHRTLSRKQDEALELARLHALDPSDLDLLRELVRNARERAAFGEAMQYQERLVDIAPSHAARLELASLWNERGDEGKTARLLTTMLQEDAPIDEAFLTVCDDLLRRDVEQGVRHLDGMLRVRPEAWPLRLRSLVVRFTMDPRVAASEAAAWLERPPSPGASLAKDFAFVTSSLLKGGGVTLSARGGSVQLQTLPPGGSPSLPFTLEPDTVLIALQHPSMTTWNSPLASSPIQGLFPTRGDDLLDHLSRLSVRNVSQILDDVLPRIASGEPTARLFAQRVLLHANEESWREELTRPATSTPRLRELFLGLLFTARDDGIVAVADELLRRDPDDAWVRSGILEWFAFRDHPTTAPRSEAFPRLVDLVVESTIWSFGRVESTAAERVLLIVPRLVARRELAGAMRVLAAYRGIEQSFEERIAIWRVCQQAGSCEAVQALARELVDQAVDEDLTNTQRAAFAELLLEPEDEFTWEHGLRTFLELARTPPDGSEPQRDTKTTVTFSQGLVTHVVPLEPIGPIEELDLVPFALLHRLIHSGGPIRRDLPQRIQDALERTQDETTRFRLLYARFVVTWFLGNRIEAQAELDGLCEAHPAHGGLALQRARVDLERGALLDIAHWCASRPPFDEPLETQCREFEQQVRARHLTRDPRMLFDLLRFELERGVDTPPRLDAFLPTRTAFEQLRAHDDRDRTPPPCAPLTPFQILEHASVTSLHGELETSLARAIERHPNAFTLRTLAAIVSLTEGRPEEYSAFDRWLHDAERSPLAFDEPAASWIAERLTDRWPRATRTLELGWRTFESATQRTAARLRERAFDRLTRGLEPTVAGPFAAMLRRAHTILVAQTADSALDRLAPLERLVELTEVYPIAWRRAWHPTLVALCARECVQRHVITKLPGRLIQRTASYWSTYDEPTRVTLLGHHLAPFFLDGPDEAPTLAAWDALTTGMPRAELATLLRLAERDGRLGALRRAWGEHPRATDRPMLELRILAAYTASDRVEAGELERLLEKH